MVRGTGKPTTTKPESPVRLTGFTSEYGQTPIEPDAREHLRPAFAHLSTNAELNRAESLNIADGMSWVLANDWTTDRLLQSSALREIHERLFGDVWMWAGQLRSREVNIGNCPPQEIAVRLEQILGNFSYQASAGRDSHDICTEYHQAVTQIHPFVNGNGRHARITTDLLGEAIGIDPESLTWGSRYDAIDERRSAYLEALRFADRGDYTALKAFIFG